MKERDIAEKILLSFNDVFADVVNGIVFNGEDVVKSEELEDAATVTQFKDDESDYREQLRDVEKFWKKNGVIFSFIGIENQSKQDKDLILRICSYDGATYSRQKGNKEVYPVFTIVLYWGKEKWNAPTCLKERMDCPPELEEFVSDHKFKLVEMARLTAEDVAKFKKDFQFIVGIIANIKGYKPERNQIKHCSETLDVLYEVEGDKRFREIREKIESDEKEGRKSDMCEYLDALEARGIEKGIERGIEQGIERGIEKGIILSLKRLMTNLKLNLEQALDALEISEQDKPQYRAMINNTK